jgi:HlyD family secretion protein
MSIGTATSRVGQVSPPAATPAEREAKDAPAARREGEGAPAVARPLSDPAGEAERRLARERRRRLVRGVRRLLAMGFAVAVVVAVALALRPRPVPVDVARATRGDLVHAIEESGVSRVKDRYVVSAPVTGSISRVSLEPGDSVEVGETLAEIAPALSPLLDERTRAESEARLAAALSALGQARAQAARAEAARDQAARELARANDLARSESITRQAVDEAEFAARIRSEELASAKFSSKVAEEQVRIARVALGKEGSGGARNRHVDVLAPVSGVVLRVQQKSAGVVQAGAPLIEVGDPAVLEVVVDLLTTDAVHVRPGTPVVIKGWGGARTLAGRVRRVEPSAFTKLSALGVEEQRVNVTVAITDAREAWAALGDGYRVEARFVLEEKRDVIKVPQGAAFRQGDGWAVFRIAEGRAHLVPVEVGLRGETELEVTNGLEAGAELAVHPGERVKDGARVEAR